MKKINLLLIIIFLTSCGSKNLGTFGKGVSITFDPRTVGMVIDDTIMQKSLIAKLTREEKKYFLLIQVEVLDGRIFVTGKVDEPEEKIKITKLAWETKGVRSVKNAIEIRGNSNFKSNATRDNGTCKFKTKTESNEDNTKYTVIILVLIIIILGLAYKTLG